MIQRFSSRRQRLDASFLCQRLQNAQSYDRIAGYFSASLLEVAGEALESVQGTIRVVCNSDLSPADVSTARAAKSAIRRSWCAAEPERLVDESGPEGARHRFSRLYEFLRSGKLQVRVLPDAAFGLIHGKAGVITLADGSKTCFMGSANESVSAWRMNYELVWEDDSPEAVAWVQEEFDALWGSPHVVELADFVIEDIGRLAKRSVLRKTTEWADVPAEAAAPDPAPVVIESPVYRQEVGLWEHQKYFVKLVFDAHLGPEGKARYVLADQVGLGKTLQLATSALLIALTGSRPILVLCPKTLVWQWQGEMRDLLDMPSAVWKGKQWVDERGIEYPVAGVEGILKCPRRVGIVSTGLVKRRSEAAELLTTRQYDCVILDEAHHARRRNLGPNRDNEKPDPNNLLAFMHEMAEHTRSLLLATATPAQLRPVEAWDLLEVLSRGHEAVLGNAYSPWRRHPDEALELVMGRAQPPADETAAWEWTRNPLPPRGEHRDFELLRRRLEVPDDCFVADGSAITRLGAPDRARLQSLAPRLFRDHHPFIRRIVRRTREQLENQLDPETNEPLLPRIGVRLLGESEEDAIVLPGYLREAYQRAERFCELLSQRLKASGFLKTLLLRRMGSSVYAGRRTAEKMLESWETIEAAEEDEEDFPEEAATVEEASPASRALTEAERDLLQDFLDALEANQERDPKYAIVRQCLLERNWLELGCIVFSQYRDSVQWLAGQLSEELPDERIAVYSGPDASGIVRAGQWTPVARDELKRRVQAGELRLMLGTDAASEGLNLQRLATLINLDLPWNPTRLEQRKGRIQRLGQVHDTVQVYNMRYKDSVEDRVHQLLSQRLHNIYDLFGQLPDVLEDAWVAMALGERERAQHIIDEVPESHPFEVRYTHVEKIDWESCAQVLDKEEKRRVLSEGW